MRPVIRGSLLVAALSFAINLPFVETVVYYTLLMRPAGQLPPAFASVTALVGAASWLLLLVCFAATSKGLKEPLTIIYKYIERVKERLRNSLGLLFLLIPALFVAVFVLDLLPETLKQLFWSKVREFGVLIALWLGIALLAWYVALLLKALSSGLLKGVRGALHEWSLGIKLSVAHFCLITGFGWFAVAPHTLPHRQKLAFVFAFSKDMFLLWIIALLLFVSLFKLGHHKALKPVFQSVGGYIQFVVICGIIAILAIWADFRTIGSAPIREMFPEQWKQELVQMHVYIRDIGLLLAPIAGLLVWTLNRVGEEMEPTAPPRQ